MKLAKNHSNTRLRIILFTVANLIPILASVAIVVAQGGSGVDQTGTGGRHTIQGRIYFPSGRRTDTRLLVRLENFSASELKVLSDLNGTFGFRGLEPGSYTVVVEGGDDYETARESVSIAPDVRPPSGVTLPSAPEIYSVQISLRPRLRDRTKPGVVNASAARERQQGNQKPTEELNIVRVSTDLVQTEIMVFDRQGHFVEGLQRDQFQLRVDDQSRQVSFLDHVVAGSTSEGGQLAAPRSGPVRKANADAGAGQIRGRNIVFFADDFHLSAESVQRTRKTILQFVEHEMASEDQVAIASATGQIGFLQQFTDNQSVLHAAIARLNYRSYQVRDSENIAMTEYLALKVDQGDRDALNYFTAALLQASNFKAPNAGVAVGHTGASASVGSVAPIPTIGMTPEQAERMVKDRAQLLLKQSTSITMNSLSSLESLVRSTARLPGRKLVFFISDGFLMQGHNTGLADRLQQITDAALRAGVVVYTMDARGLIGDSDVTSNRSDPSGQLTRANVGELAASQDGLNALAEDTGGRALLNSNALAGAVTNALRETSNYYLVGWQPTPDEVKGHKFKRIEVSIAGRPELVVRLQRGYAVAEGGSYLSTKTRDAGKSDERKPVVETVSVRADLGDALKADAPKRALPAIVSLSFIDTPRNGPVLTASFQTKTAMLDYGPDGQQPATLDLGGVVLNDQGKAVASFGTRLNVRPTNDESQTGVIYNYKTPLTPGIYQVRVAARDERSGKIGSARQWIEVPDLSLHHLTVSSLLLGAQVISGSASTNDGSGPLPQVQFSVDNRFTRASKLSFWMFVYNAARGAAGNSAPELTMQVQVTRSGRQLVATPERKVVSEGADVARILCVGQFALSSLEAGKYELRVTIKDLVSNTSATRVVGFIVE
jgi:VWFA-related protein